MVVFNPAFSISNSKLFPLRVFQSTGKESNDICEIIPFHLALFTRPINCLLNKVNICPIWILYYITFFFWVTDLSLPSPDSFTVQIFLMLFSLSVSSWRSFFSPSAVNVLLYIAVSLPFLLLSASQEYCIIFHECFCWKKEYLDSKIQI